MSFFQFENPVSCLKMNLMHFAGRRIPKKWLNIGDIYLYYPPKSGLWIGFGRLGKRVNFGMGCRGDCRRGGSKNTKVFGSGGCLSAVVDVELPVDIF